MTKKHGNRYFETSGSVKAQNHGGPARQAHETGTFLQEIDEFVRNLSLQTQAIEDMKRNNPAQWEMLTRTPAFQQHSEQFTVMSGWVNDLRVIRDNAIGLRRKSYDSDFIEFIRGMSGIDEKDIFRALRFVPPLEHSIWFEGPSIMVNDGSRMGFLVSQDQKTNAYSYRIVRKHLTDSSSGTTSSINAHPVTGVFSAEKGFSLDEEAIVNAASLFSSASSVSFEDALDIACWEHGQSALFIAATLVALGSREMHSDFYAPITREEKELLAKNTARMKAGRPPILSARPIIVDKTKPLYSRMRGEGEAVSICDLMPQMADYKGKVSVRPSRYMTRADGTTWLRQKDGEPWFRKAHKRRTRAEGDRTEVAHHLTATNPGAVVEVFPDRPGQVRNPEKCSGPKR